MVKYGRINLISNAGKIPKLDEALERKIMALKNPTLDDIAEAIREYQTSVKTWQPREGEDEIYRFTI